MGIIIPAFALALSIGANTNVGTENSSLDTGTKIIYTGNSVSGVTQTHVGSGAQASGSSTTTNAQDSKYNTNVHINITGDTDERTILITRDTLESTTIPTTIEPSNVRSHADVSGYIATQMKHDAHITAVTSSPTHVAVTYNVPVRLFGIFPIMIDTDTDVDAQGTVVVNHPWWTFMTASDSNTDVNAAITTAVQSEMSTHPEANLTANAQARIVSAIVKTLHNELSVDASTKANVSGSVNQ